ncbi:MAG: ribosome silencing factor [Longicatena sp.]
MDELLSVVQKAIDEKKGERAIVYEFNALNPYIDYVVICSASNVRQVHAIAQNIKDCVREHDFLVRAIEGGNESNWVLVDLNSIIIHVFTDDERAHFQLEKLYADLPQRDFSL